MIEVLAPAKLNLFLHIVGRREDGYHELQTVFQFINFCDRLRISPRDDGQIVRTGGLEGLPAEQDLVVRAALALREACGTKAGVTIDVDKRIPAGGGLGGGSSDAASTLVALDRLWNLGWERNRLAALGLTLGADVPVFVLGHAAWGEGVGDRLVPMDLPEAWYLVVHPGVNIPTGELFQTPELTRDSPRMTIRDFVSGGGRNDFEPVVRARYPEVDAALVWLERFGRGRLTGTGACVFVGFDSREEADAAMVTMPDCWTGFVAQGLNRSPLFGA